MFPISLGTQSLSTVHSLPIHLPTFALETHLAETRERLNEAEDECSRLRPECQRLQSAVTALQDTQVEGRESVAWRNCE